MRKINKKKKSIQMMNLTLLNKKNEIYIFYLML